MLSRMRAPIKVSILVLLVAVVGASLILVGERETKLYGLGIALIPASIIGAIFCLR